MLLVKHQGKYRYIHRLQMGASTKVQSRDPQREVLGRFRSASHKLWGFGALPCKTRHRTPDLCLAHLQPLLAPALCCSAHPTLTGQRRSSAAASALENSLAAFGGCLREDRDALSFPLTFQTTPQFPFVSKTSPHLTSTLGLLAIQRIQTNFTDTTEVPADVYLPKLKPDKCTRKSWPVYEKKVLTDLG